MPSPTPSPPPISPVAAVPGLRTLGISATAAAPGNRFAKGTNIASSTTIGVPDTSGYFHVTGTTTISYVSTTNLTDGVPFDVYFESALQLNHNAGSIPGGTVKITLAAGVNLAVAAGTTIGFRYDATVAAVIQTSTSANTSAASDGPAGTATLRTLGTTATSAAPGDILNKGTDIASASSITIPASGSLFHVTGTTGITYISTTNLFDGRPFDLRFVSGLTVNHNGGSPPGGTVKILLASGLNTSFAAGLTVTFRYDVALSAVIQIGSGGSSGAAGRLLGIATHISGTTAAPPVGTAAMLVRGAAGGGGGGGAAAASTANHRVCGAGGSAGGEIYFYTTNIPANYTFTLGAGGAAGTSGGGNGGTGGNLVFSDGTTTVTGFGGIGGEGDASDGTTGTARQGGAAPADSTNVSRPTGSQPGGNAFAVVDTTHPTGFSGSGGTGSFGAGGAGWTSGSNTGRNGLGNGSGGGGARDNGSGAKAGGVGAAAILNIEFYS